MSGKRRIALNENYFDVIDTPEKAYWLGFLVTDGSIYYNEIEIKLTAGDSGHLEKFVSALDAAYPVQNGVNNHGTAYAKVRLGCLYMVKSLAQHGIVRGKRNNQPWNGPPELLPHYWRGAVDGDGWITTSERAPVVGFCGSPQMVDAFIAFADEHMPAQTKLKTLSKVSHGGIYQVVYGGIWVAQAMCRLLKYDDLSHTALDRKRERAALLLERTPKQKAPNRALSDDDACSVCHDWNTGEYTTKQLATKYNISKSTIYNIIDHTGRFADVVLPVTQPLRAIRQSLRAHAQC